MLKQLTDPKNFIKQRWGGCSKSVIPPEDAQAMVVTVDKNQDQATWKIYNRRVLCVRKKQNRTLRAVLCWRRSVNQYQRSGYDNPSPEHPELTVEE